MPRLKPSWNTQLPYLLAAVLLFLAAGAVAKAADAGWAVQAGFGAMALALALMAAYRGPLRHAMAGVIHLVAHPRPARVRGERDVALPAVDLTGDSLGTGRMEEFAWNRLTSFDACVQCVQCGRCEAACPAYAAGQVLNPKAVILDLSAAIGDPSAPTPDVVSPEALWACTTCRACVYECPMLIEHVDTIVAMRRFEVMELGAVPARSADALANLGETDTQGGAAAAARLDWAVDLHLPILAEGAVCDVLFWLGEAAYDLRGQRTLRAFVKLLRAARVDFAVLGEAELDSGDLARRIGDEATFVDLARRNVEILSRRRFHRIATADPHVFNLLKNEYPAFGGDYAVFHHSQILAELIDAGRLVARAKTGESVTYHDPCYLSRYNGETEASRRVLAALGASPVEMERSGMRSSCCGGGGGAPLAAVPGRRQIAENRMDHVRATGAPIVVVGCPQCAQMLEGVPGARPAVVDLAELVLRAVEEGPP